MDGTEHQVLIFASDTSIIRHVKIKAEANPYNPEFKEYFRNRHIARGFQRESMKVNSYNLFIHDHFPCQKRKISLVANHLIAECHFFHLSPRNVGTFPSAKAKKPVIHLQRLATD